MTPAEAKARRAEYAHSKERKNLAGPNWACSENGPYFKDGAMNRDPHSDLPGAEPTRSSMGRTVRVEHYHYRAPRED